MTLKVKICAIGSKMPAWVTEGCQVYLDRMPREFQVSVNAVALVKRHKNVGAAQLKIQEGKSLLEKISPQDVVVAMEEKGDAWSTRELANKLNDWRHGGRDVALLVGGPDGLADSCRQRANAQWSLSPLTLPHALVRIIIAEQLYRAWSVLQGHPYHRE